MRKTFLKSLALALLSSTILTGTAFAGTWAGKKYWKDDGNPARAEMLTIGQNTYYFNVWGDVDNGWVQIDGKNYHFNISGIMDPVVSGTWAKTGAGWTYLKDNGQYAKSEFIIDTNEQKIYYIGDDGIMKTGFVPINGEYYYFDESGVKQIGWVKDGNDWRYMDPRNDGAMAVNRSFYVRGLVFGSEYSAQYINYYADESGKIIHDTYRLADDGRKIYYSSSGVCVGYNQPSVEHYSSDSFNHSVEDAAKPFALCSHLAGYMIIGHFASSEEEVEAAYEKLVSSTMRDLPAVCDELDLEYYKL